MRTSAPFRQIAFMCCAELLATIPAGTYAPLITVLRVSWNMTNAQAGLVDGAFQTGYLLTSPLLVVLTDRIDAKRIFVAAAALSSVSSVLLALFASDWLSAALFRLAAGIGLAGTYLPGLRVLSDRLAPAFRTRATAYYTASFSAGTSVAVMIVGVTGPGFGWQAGFAAAAVAAFGAAIMCGTVDPAPVRSQVVHWREALDVRPALANRSSLAFNLAYAAHMWELYGFRAWLVTFLVFFAARSGVSPGAVPVLASFVVLVALPASIFGNELSERLGRVPVVSAIMLGSGLMALVVPTFSHSLFSAVLLCCVYSFLVSADSGALTAGAVQFATPGRHGATLAVHSIAGFFAAGVSPLAVGLVLDHGHGVQAWIAAFAVLGAGVLAGPVILRIFKPGISTTV